MDLVALPNSQVEVQVLWSKCMFCCSVYFDKCVCHIIDMIASAMDLGCSKDLPENPETSHKSKSLDLLMSEVFVTSFMVGLSNQ